MKTLLMYLHITNHDVEDHMTRSLQIKWIETELCSKSDQKI